MNTKYNDNYKMIEEQWTCWDGCCFNSEIYVEKNDVRYTEIIEDNWSKYERDINFIWEEDVIEFILFKEYKIKIERYMTDWQSDTFQNSDADYLILDWNSTKWFDDYMYILDRRDYLNNLNLEGLNKKNIITKFKKKKEPSEIYSDLFKKITWCKIWYVLNDLDHS